MCQVVRRKGRCKTGAVLLSNSQSGQIARALIAGDSPELHHLVLLRLVQPVLRSETKRCVTRYLHYIKVEWRALPPFCKAKPCFQTRVCSPARAHSA